MRESHRQDSQVRRKRLSFVLHNPEEAKDPAELDRACQYADWMVGELQQARESVDGMLDQLEDPDSEVRQKMDATKRLMDEALDGMNEAIGQVEDALVAKFVGRCAAHELDVTGWALLFWQQRGVWGLYGVNGEGQLHRLNTTPKNVRMAALAVLEDMVVGLQYEDEVEGVP